MVITRHQETHDRSIDFFVVVILAALIVPAFLTPDGRMLGTHTQLFLPPCLFHAITKVPCPFCGLTTSFTWLVHGAIGRSFLAHPAGPLLYLSLWIIVISYGVGRILHRPLLNCSYLFSGMRLLYIIGFLWLIRLSVWVFQLAYGP